MRVNKRRFSAAEKLKVAIDVAEQIRDVLSGKSARSAVNIPYLRAELLEPVKEYMNLAENIGLLARQISEGVYPLKTNTYGKQDGARFSNQA